MSVLIQNAKKAPGGVYAPAGGQITGILKMQELCIILREPCLSLSRNSLYLQLFASRCQRIWIHLPPFANSFATVCCYWQVHLFRCPYDDWIIGPDVHEDIIISSLTVYWYEPQSYDPQIRFHSSTFKVACDEFISRRNSRPMLPPPKRRKVPGKSLTLSWKMPKTQRLVQVIRRKPKSNSDLQIPTRTMHRPSRNWKTPNRLWPLIRSFSPVSRI